MSMLFFGPSQFKYHVDEYQKILDKSGPAYALANISYVIVTVCTWGKGGKVVAAIKAALGALGYDMSTDRIEAAVYHKQRAWEISSEMIPTGGEWTYKPLSQ